MVTDSGGLQGIAIDVQGGTEAVMIRRNALQESRGAAQRIGIRLGPDTKDIQLADNTIAGFAQPVMQMPKT